MTCCKQFGMFPNVFLPPLCSGEHSFARVQVCPWDACPWRGPALCQRPAEAFFQFPRGKIEWDGKSFVEPDESNALMHGLVPFLVLCSLRHPRICLLLQMTHWRRRVKENKYIFLEDQMSFPLADSDDILGLQSSSNSALQQWFSQNLPKWSLSLWS